MGDTYRLKYRIDNDTLLIEEFDTQCVDNPELKEYKTREDKYFYNGEALIMVGSTMFNMEGKKYIAEIEMVIKYSKE